MLQDGTIIFKFRLYISFSFTIEKLSLIEFYQTLLWNVSPLFFLICPQCSYSSSWAQHCLSLWPSKSHNYFFLVLFFLKYPVIISRVILEGKYHYVTVSSLLETFSGSQLLIRYTTWMKTSASLFIFTTHLLSTENDTFFLWTFYPILFLYIFCLFSVPFLPSPPR